MALCIGFKGCGFARYFQYRGTKERYFVPYSDTLEIWLAFYTLGQRKIIWMPVPRATEFDNSHREKHGALLDSEIP